MPMTEGQFIAAESRGVPSFLDSLLELLVQRMGFAFVVLLAGVVSARADCAADFRTILRQMEEMGPSRIESVWINGSARAETRSDFVSPASFHVVSKTSRGDSEFISVGRRMWLKKSGIWQALDDGQIDAVLRERSRQGFFYSKQARNIECHANGSTGSVKYATFTYKALVGTRAMVLTLAVDAGTRRPVKLEGHADDGGLDARLSSTVTFAPSIKIVPPQLP
ncbi:hypothetical protein [Labrys neptuniae]